MVLKTLFLSCLGEGWGWETKRKGVGGGRRELQHQQEASENEMGQNWSGRQIKGNCGRKDWEQNRKESESSEQQRNHKKREHEESRSYEAKKGIHCHCLEFKLQGQGDTLPITICSPLRWKAMPQLQSGEKKAEVGIQISMAQVGTSWSTSHRSGMGRHGTSMAHNHQPVLTGSCGEY